MMLGINAKKIISGALPVTIGGGGGMRSKFNKRMQRPSDFVTKEC